MVHAEQMKFRAKPEKAKIPSSQFCSVIEDEADQPDFGLLGFVTKTRNIRGRAFKVKLIGLLDHGKPNWLQLYTMAEEHETMQAMLLKLLTDF